MAYEVGAGKISIFPAMNGFKKSVNKEVDSATKEGSNRFRKGFDGNKLGSSFGASFKASFNSASGKDFLTPFKESARKASSQAKSALLDYKAAVVNSQAAQDKMNAAIEKYGANSTQAQKATIAFEKAELRKANALEKSNAAAEKAKIAQETLKAATEEYNRSNTSILGSLKAVASNLGNGFKGIDNVKNSTQNLSSAFGQLARALLGVDTIWIPLMQKMGSMGTSMFITISGQLAQFGAKINNSLQAAINNIQKALSGIGAKLSSIFGPIGSSIANFWTKLTTPIANFGQMIGSKISAAFSTVSAKVGAFFAPITSRISAAVTPIVNAAKTTWTNYTTGVKTAINNVVSTLPPSVQKVVNTSGNLLGTLAAKAGSAFKNAGTGVLKGIKSIATGSMAILSAGALALGGTILATGKQALAAYATWEQAVGGVDTLFKDASGTVQQYAAGAYKTAGISANDYMNQVTSFAASLVSSLGGDTRKAAELGNTAILDMSDNANKMGTSIDSIQQTYQSLARGNYAMLDNLKLGYGGTKSEMKRLISDANKLREANGQAGDLTIDKFSDVVTAIHLVQQQMGITGTTAREAASTIEGSVNSMKAAWNNWLAGLGQNNADMADLSKQLTESIATALQNILPRIGQIIKGIVSAIPSMFEGLVSALPKPFQDAINAIMNIFQRLGKAFQPLHKAIAPLTTAFVALGAEGIGGLLTKLPFVGELFEGLMGPLKFLSGPIGIILSLLVQLVATSPQLQKTFGKLGSDVMKALGDSFNQLLPVLQSLMGVFNQLINAVTPLVTQILQQIVPLLSPIITMLISTCAPVLKTIMDVGTQLLVSISQLITALSPVIIGIIQTIIQVLQSMMPVIQALLTGAAWCINEAVKLISAILVPIINFIAQVVRDNMGTIQGILQNIQGVIQGVVNFVTAIIRGDWQGAWNAFKDILSNAAGAVGGALNVVKDAITRIFSNAGNWLKDAGQKIVSGLIDGIKSMAQNAGNAIKGVMDTIAKFIPHSPAKKGPFSGHGWTPYSGQALVEGLAEGITTATPHAALAMRRTMQGIHSQLNGVGAKALNVNGTAGTAGVNGSGLNVVQNISVPDPLAAGRAGVQMLNMAIA